MNIIREFTIAFKPQSDKVKELPDMCFTTPSAIAEFAKQFYDDDLYAYESMFCLYLDKSLQPVGWVKIGQGTIDSCSVDPMLIAKYAIDSLSKHAIIVHNHPSGNKQPSQDDIQMTHHVAESLKMFGCKLIDHIILCPSKDNTQYTSFSELGKL